MLTVFCVVCVVLLMWIVNEVGGVGKQAGKAVEMAEQVKKEIQGLRSNLDNLRTALLPMTERQGEEIIKLLEKILSQVEDAARGTSDTRRDLKAANDYLFEISLNTRKMRQEREN